MNEWKTVRADQYCFSVTDGTHDSPKPKSAGRKLITSKHLKGHYIDFDSANWISEEDYQKVIARSAVEQWDILYSMIGTIGNMYIEKNATIDYACKNMGIFKFNGNKDNAYWMYYYLKSPQAAAYIHSHLRGSTQAYVPLGGLREMPVPIPPIEIRHRIVSILKSIDDRIENNMNINDNLLRQAQLLFQSWFVDYQPFGGQMPNDWTEGVFADIVDFSNGYAFKSKELIDTPQPDCYRVFKQGHIFRGGGFNPDGTKSWYPRCKADGLKRYVLKKGDILMAMTDMKDNVQILGNTAIMEVDDQYIVNQRVGVLRCKKELGISYPYIFLLTNDNEFLLDLRSRANSGVQVNLSSTEIKNSPIYIAPRHVYDEFTNIVLPMFETIISNDIQNQQLAELRDTLLPKLMSGEISVKDIN